MMGLVGVLGLVIYSLLNIGTILGAKNTAVNTAHQQARVAMLEMMQDLHSSISLPALVNVNGTQAAGISFQQWGSTLSGGVITPNGGPHKIRNDAAKNQNVVHIVVTTGQPSPAVGQRFIVPTHQIEEDITGVSGSKTDLSLTLGRNLTVAINGTGNGTSTIGDVICYITDRCSYNVVLDSAGPPQSTSSNGATHKARGISLRISQIHGLSVFRPHQRVRFTIVSSPRLICRHRIGRYSNRGYKSANILLNGQVPFRTRLTTYQ